MSSIFEYAFNHPILNEVLDTLTLKQFFRESNTTQVGPANEQFSLSETELNKASLLASLLASSPNDEHKQKAISFAILAYLEKRNRQYESYCYVLLSRSRNIQQTRHLSKIFNSEKNSLLVKFDDVLDLEISLERALASLQLHDSQIYLSDFQKRLWQGLNEAIQIMAISGPTSAGKSFMVQNYITELCRKKSRFKALYIVPTKALIYEVSAILRKKLEKDVSVRIAFGEPSEVEKKEIFVLTPERCLRLLQESPNELKIDFIFFDEIQKLEDAERGVLFEYILNELLRLQSEAKIVMAGPYLKNLTNTVMQLSGLFSPVVDSRIAPVFQLKTVFRVLKANNNQMTVFLKSASGKTIKTTIATEKAQYSRLKSNSKKAMAEFVAAYGADSTNILFAPRRTTAEHYALALAEVTSDNDHELNKNKRINELIEYLSHEIHPRYSLIRCLEKGVAFHHGMIPELAKLEIEELYKNGDIKNMACTSTLLEGVNLPADKIFIYRPFKNDRRTPLDDFEFGNLIGRAGRVSSKLNGSVYCIELENEKWANEKLDSDFRKEIIPATNRAFNQREQLIANLKKPSTLMNADQAVIYTIILLRHKALRSPSELRKYLQRKGLDTQEIDLVSKNILESIRDLAIPKEILRLNPTLDPLLQDVLYHQIKGNEREWFIGKHPLSRDGLNSREANFAEKNFYRQFEEVAAKLNKIFDIESSINKQYGESRHRSYSIFKIVYNAVLWLQQKTLRYIIEKDLDGENVDLPQLDKVVLEVIARINNDVRFELVKYFNLWADILRSMVENHLVRSDDSEKEQVRKWLEYQLSVPEMLELGACTPTAIQLIRSGINRSAAIEASKCIPQYIEGDPLSWLVENRLHTLSPIFQRHIRNQGF